MKILVFSDSHGSYGKMSEIFRNIRCDAVIFLGDGLSDAERLYKTSGAVPVYRVCGNCDFMPLGVPDMQLLELDGARVLITHGHRQGVKSGTDALEAQARRMNSDVALFGHTHRQFYEKRGGLILANPGSVAAGKYAVLTTGKEIHFEFGEMYD